MGEWSDITAAIGWAQGGERWRGAQALAACWEQSTATDHAQHCVIAHYLADLQPHLAEEVAWDERAWAAYVHLNDEDLTGVGIPHVHGLAASLHLNLGDGYLRQGRIDRAQDHLEAGLAAQKDLNDAGYGPLVGRGLAGLQERIRSIPISTGD